MTEDQFLERLAALVNSDPESYGDPEAEHSAGDTLVAQALMSVGWASAAHAYNKAREDWWYA